MSFLIHALSLKSSDFRESVIMLMSRFGMLVYCLAKLMESVSSFYVMEG